MKPRRRIRPLGIVLILAIVGIAAFIVYARTRPALELYTTPPLD